MAKTHNDKQVDPAKQPAPQPQEGLAEEQIIEAIAKIIRDDFYVLQGKIIDFMLPPSQEWIHRAEIIFFKLRTLKWSSPQEVKDKALLFESRILGIDEFNDWSDEGLRAFREKVIPIIGEFVKALKGGA